MVTEQISTVVECDKKIQKMQNRKKIFSIAINTDILLNFNNYAKTNAINKSALIEKLIVDWMTINGL